MQAPRVASSQPYAPPVMPFVRHQRRSASSSRSRPQSRQLSAHRGHTRADQRLVADQLIKTDAEVASHGCSVAFLMADVAISRQHLADILRLVTKLRQPLIDYRREARSVVMRTSEYQEKIMTR